MLTKVKREAHLDKKGFQINPNLPPEQRVAILDVVMQYQGCFANSIEEIRIEDKITNMIRKLG
jgi:hypothetical protein